MAYIPSSPPVILPLPESQHRPLWSVMIPVYNCAQFLPEALESVMMQEIPEGEMQIEVIDDASTDIDVAALVLQIGKGRVKYFRQEQNVGSLVNFETCINRAKGTLIHILHGDDKVRNGYYLKIAQLFKQYPEAGAAFCRFSCINEYGRKVYDKRRELRQPGVLLNWLETIGERQHIQYAAITVRREVYEKLGAFYGITYGEDWEMWVRIACHYQVAYSPDILADYRAHSNSISNNKFISGEYLQDLLRAMNLIQEYLPENKKKNILRKSKKYYAYYGLKMASRLWSKLHDQKIVNAQVKQILGLYQSPKLYLLIFLLHLKISISKL